MSGNVIKLIFPDTAVIAGMTVKVPKSRGEYLLLLKKFLTEDDYERILCSIIDENYYSSSEKELQQCVDAYYGFTY